MKKSLRLSLIIVGLMVGVASIWMILMPEKQLGEKPFEVKAADSTENEIYRKDVLAEHNKNVHKKISEELERIENSRKMNLIIIEDAVKMYGAYSKEVENLVAVKDAQDAADLEKVTGILDKHGWPATENIGAQNTYTLFTTIQNSDLKTQEKYIPLMKKAVESGTLLADYFANLVDRKAIAQHQKQIYGTVVTGNWNENKFQFAPIIEAQTVNERRKEIGLCTLEEYAKKMNIIYTPV